LKEVLDSRFFAAHFSGGDPDVADAARSKLKKLRREGRGILPTVVIAEVVNLLCRGIGRNQARAAFRAMAAYGLDVVPLDETIAAEAGLLKCIHRDLPLADAIVASLALREDGRVISDDPHFEAIQGLRVSWLE